MRAIPPAMLCVLLVAAMTAADEPPARAPVAINRICPVSGDAIDRDLPAVPVTVQSDGRTLTIGIATCCTRCAEKVRARPEAYVAAAVAGRRVTP